MFKVKDKKTGEIVIALTAMTDDLFGKTWFLLWENAGWRWRSADNYCPPNWEIEKDESK